MSTSSTQHSSHTKDLVDPPLISEVKQLSLNVSVENWVYGVCRVSKETLEQWMTVIKENKFFEDPVIDRALSKFCSASREFSRYAPLSDLLNRLLRLVHDIRDKFDNLSDTRPIDDLVYFRNDPICLRGPEEQGDLAALRKPDVIGARKVAKDTHRAGDRLAWHEALLCFELKYDGKLLQKLNAKRQSHKLPELSRTTITKLQPS